MPRLRFLVPSVVFFCALALAQTTPKPIAVHDFPTEGVSVALTQVQRTSPDTITVKWEYRNSTAKPQKLAGDSKGWSDPYRLAWDTYVLANGDPKQKSTVMKDDKGNPVAAMHGAANQLTITVPAKKTVKTWAKYSLPAGTEKVTFVVTGVEPFEGVAVTSAP